MFNREERKWERMREVLLAEANGRDPCVVASKRTLFGIPSSVEQMVEGVAAEENDRCQRIIEQKKNQA